MGKMIEGKNSLGILFSLWIAFAPAVLLVPAVQGKWVLPFIALVFIIGWECAVSFVKRRRGKMPPILIFEMILDMTVPVMMMLAQTSLLVLLLGLLQKWRNVWAFGSGFLMVVQIIVFLVFAFLITSDIVSCVAVRNLGEYFPGNMTGLMRMCFAPGKFVVFTFMTILGAAVLCLRDYVFGYIWPEISFHAVTGTILRIACVLVGGLIFRLLFELIRRQTNNWMTIYGKKKSTGHTTKGALITTRVVVISVSIALFLTNCYICFKIM